VDGSRLGSRAFLPGLRQSKKCPLIQLGPNPPTFLTDGQAKPFDPSAFAACVAEAPGYSMGFDATIRTQSIADAARFLQRNLQP
jgi:hypothetical protein